MRCASLITGSKANSFYVESNNGAILIDAGLSLPKTQSTCAMLGIDLAKIKAIFLTHEHDDHIRHLRRIASFLKVPVYLSEPSLRNSGLHLKDTHIIAPGDVVDLNGMTIEAFRVEHDVELCLGFVLQAENKKMFYASDIGSYDDTILRHAENSNFIGIESNYDPDMLERCFYPQHLKDRIKGGSGHLSNPQACSFVREAASDCTKHIMYLHLSENSNRVGVVERMIDADLHPFRPDIQHTIGLRHSNTSLVTL